MPLGKEKASLASWKNSIEVNKNPKYTDEWPEEDHDLAEDDLVGMNIHTFAKS